MVGRWVMPKRWVSCGLEWTSTVVRNSWRCSSSLPSSSHAGASSLHVRAELEQKLTSLRGSRKQHGSSTWEPRWARAGHAARAPPAHWQPRLAAPGGRAGTAGEQRKGLAATSMMLAYQMPVVCPVEAWVTCSKLSSRSCLRRCASTAAGSSRQAASSTATPRRILQVGGKMMQRRFTLKKGCRRLK